MTVQRGQTQKKTEEEEAEDVDSDSADEEKPRPKAKAKSSKSKAPGSSAAPTSNKTRQPTEKRSGSGGGIRWEPGDGLYIDVRLSTTLLMNCAAVIVLILGFIFFAQQHLATTCWAP